MKTSLALGSALALLLVSGVSSAANIAYKATLNGKQETPANASAATGVSTNLVFNDSANGGNAKELTGTITLTGIAATTAQHIHLEACGVPGAVAITLPAPVGGVITIPNNTKLNAAQETALAAGKLYINIHTAAFPNGE
ncbi:MAG TPA: CHRD domain-containing protein, partial [Labilithrix sp.]|nr:CHRD domain-containing protein [Labilithrix sp.]